MKRIALFHVLLAALGPACSGGPPAENLASVFVNKTLGCAAQPDPAPEALISLYLPIYRQIFDRLASAKGSGFGSDKMSACATAVEKLACEDLASDLPAACRPPGSLATGTACLDDTQCQSGFCRSGTGGACGTCLSPATIGQLCTDMTPCARGLTCFTGRCVERGGLGATCGAAGLCRSSLSCVDNTCAAPGKTGDRCGQPNTPSCGPGLTCRNNLCVGLLRAGQSCDPALTGKQCGEFARCDATTRQCTAPIAVRLGEACSDPMNRICVDGYCAMSGKCTPFLEDGAACTPGGQSGCKILSTCRNNVCMGQPVCPQ